MKRILILRGESVLFLLAALLLAAGCSGKNKDNKDAASNTDKPAADKPNGGEPEPKRPANSVSGKVTLNGQPVAGMVVFVGTDNKELPPSPINSEGTYYLDNPPAGSYRVAVRPTSPPNLLGGPMPPKTPKLPDLPDAPKQGGVIPPAKFSDPSRSGLTFEVKGGNQTFDIMLEK